MAYRKTKTDNNKLANKQPQNNQPEAVSPRPS